MDVEQEGKETPGKKEAKKAAAKPGLTVLCCGLTYNFSIGPLLNFGPVLSGKVKAAYRHLGALFAAMGLVFWALG
jgi:hypothetical protein